MAIRLATSMHTAPKLFKYTKTKALFTQKTIAAGPIDSYP